MSTRDDSPAGRLPRRAALLSLLAAAALTQPAPAQIQFKGMSYTPWSENALLQPTSDQSIADMKVAGVNTVALNAWWFQDTISASVITPDFTRYSASTESVVHAIREIHDQGMGVMLKPMVDCRSGDWRGAIQPSAAWFGGYGSFINGWADIAQAEGVEMLSVGCEFKAATGWTSSWRGVVDGVRARYSGPLLYSANHDEYRDVAWWDALDYIGIDAYFALTDQDDPTPAELAQAWQAESGAIQTWRAGQGYDQLVLFSEVGYRSVDGANRQPWDWAAGGTLDLQEQVDCYEALLETMWPQDWFGGPFWWNWETDPDAGGPADIDFTPQNKPAEQLLASYYVPHPGDANEDRFVDAGDLGIVIARYGQSGQGWAQGDFTGEGTVNVGDLGVLGAHYGWSGGTGGAVPEPAALCLLALTVGAMVGQRRRPAALRASMGDRQRSEKGERHVPHNG